MEKVIKYIKDILSRRKKLDQRFFVFIFFLLLSTIFWFLQALSKNYTTTILYPVRYTDYPANKILVGEENLPTHLNLKVNAYGFTLLQYKLSTSLLPIIFNLNSTPLNMVSNSDSSRYYLLTDLYTSQVAEQLSTEINVLDIEPDSVFFTFSNIIRKKVAVVPKVEIELEKQFMLDGKITSKPDSVLISGANTILDTIKYIETEPLSFSKLNKATYYTTSLREINEITIEKNNKVEIYIPVAEFTEARLQIPVEIENLPDSLILKTFPNRITTNFLVSLKDYDKIKVKDFKAIVDFNDIKGRFSQNKLRVRLKKSSGKVRALNFYPRKVEFIIEK